MKRPEGLLRKILEQKKETIADAKRHRKVTELKERGEEQGYTRGFLTALQGITEKQETAVIAEIKRASPSRGILCEPFQPLELARQYAQAGATCLSVLTEEHFFKGSGVHLDMIRRYCFLPVLRKDFIIDPWQIVESRAYGADALLLIAKALSGQQMADLLSQADELGMDALVEIHDEADLEYALELGEALKLIGINNRNLSDFTTRLDVTLRLASEIPPEANYLLVSESGIHNRADVLKLQDASVYAFLIGEALLTADDPKDKLREICGKDETA